MSETQPDQLSAFGLIYGNKIKWFEGSHMNLV